MITYLSMRHLPRKQIGWAVVFYIEDVNSLPDWLVQGQSWSSQSHQPWEGKRERLVITEAGTVKQNDHVHTRWGIREGRTRSTCKGLYSGQRDKVDFYVIGSMAASFIHYLLIIIILCIPLPQCKRLLSGVGSPLLPWAPRIKLRLSSIDKNQFYPLNTSSNLN